MPLPPGVFRADHVGSLLRPAPVKHARAAAAAGTLPPAALRAVEDASIAAAVARLRTAGVRALTDGEFRRAYFHLDFCGRLRGVETRGAIGASAAGPGGWTPPRLVVVGRLGRPEGGVQTADYRYVQGLAGEGETVKVCVPSPTMVHFRGGRASIDVGAYPDMDSFFADLARVWQEELQGLYEAGARFVQLDDTNLAYLCDEGMRQAARERGEDPDLLPMRYAVGAGFMAETDMLTGQRN